MPSSGARAWDEPAALAPTRRRLDLVALATWLANNFLAERARWSLWLPAFIGAGIGAYFWLRFEPPLWLGPAALAASFAAVVAAAKIPRFVHMIAPAAIATALALGFSLAQFQTWLVAAPVLEYRLGPVAVEGRIVSIDPLPEGTRLVIAPSYVERLTSAATPARLRVRLRGDAEGLLPGDWLRLRAILMPPPAPAVPGAYDFERRAYFDRLGAVGFALGKPQTIAAPSDVQPSRWRGLIAATRTNVTARIRAALPGRDGAIASAIMTGATHAIAPEDAGAFRDAGLAHILVIAGLHMGMLAGIVFFAVRALLALIPAIALRYSIKKWAALAALLASFGYLLLSDATVSSRRAFVMVALMLLGVMLDRVTFSARTLAYAAVGIMVLAPEAATSPSFQMSFAAVSGLVACYEALRPRMAQWHSGAGLARRVALYLSGIALTTVVTTLATMPFTIYHFNRFPIYSIAANIVAVPITGFWIMPWAILSMLAMPFGLEYWPLQPMGWGIEAVARIAHAVTAIPGAVLHVPSMPAFGLILLAFGAVYGCASGRGLGAPWRWRRWWRVSPRFSWSSRPIFWFRATVI
jgi:competence protein ComEC